MAHIHVLFTVQCNNFKNQEPGTNGVIMEFADQKGASFPIFGKLECENGDKTHPLYAFLKSHFNNKKIPWNFTKFLCDANGIPIEKYGPKVSPLSLEADILKLLDL